MKDFRDIVSFLLFIILAWAIAKGVTVDGKHYRVLLTEKGGVEIR